MCDSLRYWIYGENFCLLEGRKNIFLSASRSQFILTRPAKILKIVQQIKILMAKSISIGIFNSKKSWKGGNYFSAKF